MFKKYIFENLLGALFGKWSLSLQVKEQLAAVDEVKYEIEPIGRLKWVI